MGHVHDSWLGRTVPESLRRVARCLGRAARRASRRMAKARSAAYAVSAPHASWLGDDRLNAARVPMLVALQRATQRWAVLLSRAARRAAARSDPPILRCAGDPA